MLRSDILFNQFRFFVLLIALILVRLALTGRTHQAHKLPTRIAFIICGVLVTPVMFGGGFIARLYVRLIKWVLQHLHTTEDHRWVVALGITALCDIFLDTLNMAPFIVLSALSMMMICVVAAGWDSDRSGMTEGLLIGFGKLLVAHMIELDLLPSVLCGVVLVLAITSKLTESSITANAGNPLHVGVANSSSPIAGV